MGHSSSVLILFLLAIVSLEAGDMMRKSIVFDKNTPGVFYCPQRKPTGFDKLIVRARPLNKLCEFDGKPIPNDYKSDCYNDIDETEFACKEKARIMVAVGISLIFKGKFDLRGEAKLANANRINNYVVVGVFLVTIINVFIAAFSIRGETPSVVSQSSTNML